MPQEIKNQYLEALREWVRAEIKAAIADSQEDESGYTGGGHAERRIADEKFAMLFDFCHPRAHMVDSCHARP